MADTYELAEKVDAVTTAEDGSVERHRFSKGTLAHPTEAQVRVLEELLVPTGVAKRRGPSSSSSGGAKRGGRKGQKADEAGQDEAQSSEDAEQAHREAHGADKGAQGRTEARQGEEG